MKKLILFLLIGSLYNKLSAQVLQWTSLANPDSLQVNAVSFYSNDNKILSATNCHPAHIRIWNSLSGMLLWDYEVPTSLMCIMGAGVSSNSNYLVAVEEMGNILVFDNTTPLPDSIYSISMGTSYAFSIHTSPNSEKMTVGASNGKLQCYKLSDGAQLFNINAHSSWVTAVQFSNDNLKIASGGNDNKIKIWDTNGVLLQTLNGHTDDIVALRFNSANDTLWSASLDNTIRCWNANSGALLQTLVVSNSDILGMDYNKPTNTIVTVSKDKWIRFLNATTLQFKDSIIQANNAEPSSVAFSSIGTSIVTGTSNGLVTKYDISAILGNQEIYSNSSYLTCYPNPSNGHFYISSQNTFSAFTVQNIEGKEIENGKINSTNRIDLNSLLPGFYILTVKDKNNFKQFIKIQIQ